MGVGVGMGVGAGVGAGVDVGVDVGMGLFFFKSLDNNMVYSFVIGI